MANLDRRGHCGAKGSTVLTQVLGWTGVSLVSCHYTALTEEDKGSSVYEMYSLCDLLSDSVLSESMS